MLLNRLTALMLTLTASACAAGGAAPTSDTADTPLHRAAWLPHGEARAVMLALHGYGDHAESTFGEAGPGWAERGIAVHAYDHRGFGHSAEHGQWPGADRLIADAVAETQRLRQANPGLPLYLLGHSMGGGIALAALAEGAPADGAVLVAPAMAGGGRVGPVSRAALWTMTQIVPDRRFTGEGIVRKQATDNIAELRRLAADPLYIGAPNPREIMGLVRVMDRATARATSVGQPVLVLIGERDEFVDPDDVAAVAAMIPGLDRLERYPEGWHLLMRDLQGSTVRNAIADWVLQPR